MPNELAFSCDGRRLFFTDSFAHTVHAFDYDAKTGKTENQRVFLQTNPKDGFPDGLTVDAEDHLWLAAWGSACVLRYSPNGRETMRLPVPTYLVARLTFGSDDLRTLFITTAGGDERAEGEYAGALFEALTLAASIESTSETAHRGVTAAAEFSEASARTPRI